MKPYIVSACLLLSLLLALKSAARDSGSSGSQSRSHASTTRQPAPADAGEQVFESNCARCHTPPMTLPQRVTGTVLMHMRVRGRLSRTDEHLLLHYMAP